LKAVSWLQQLARVLSSAEPWWIYENGAVLRLPTRSIIPSVLHTRISSTIDAELRKCECCCNKNSFTLLDYL
jgi:hypothetical protein